MYALVAWPAQQVNKAHNNNTWDITFYYKCCDASCQFLYIAQFVVPEV